MACSYTRNFRFIKHFPHVFPNFCCSNSQTITFKNNKTFLKPFIFIRSESLTNFCTQCVIMTFAGGEGGGRENAITNDAFTIIEFEISIIAICFSYIYLMIDEKRQFIN